MGTNYYMQIDYMQIDACQHCGRSDDELHIGKASAGWVFSLNTHPDSGVNTLDDWRAEWANKRIRDEYGDTLTPEEMERVITQRGRERNWDDVPYSYTSWAEFHRCNQSLPGPNGLLRHQIDGSHCIAHGEGTFDLMRGEFC